MMMGGCGRSAQLPICSSSVDDRNDGDKEGVIISTRVM